MQRNWLSLVAALALEDGTEAMLFMQWESRGHFVAYRQSEAFYEVISSLDA